MDNGGFFPEASDSLYRDKAWFLMDGMVLLGTDAVGMSEKELKYGRSWLLAQLKRSKLPMTNANVWDKGTKKTLLPQYLIVKKGAVNVGVFALTSDKVDLGPSRDSLTLEEPAKAATRVVAEMRKKGATVVVLLSQLGKVESEDLAAAVPGIDAVICGHNVPLLQKGRMVKNTVTSYGGEQGQYVSQTTITLDAKGKMTTGENESFILGPEIPDKPEITKVVKDFEDALNEKLRKAEKERAAEVQQQVTQQTDHFLGADLCQRCHQGETAQWKTTSHSMAWQTLIEVKKDATPECIGCHVVGYKAPGGFQGSTDAPRLVNVQCENCHGMGTRHEDYSSKLKVTAQTCTNCHHGENDPEFNWDKKLPMVAHGNMSGETVQRKKIKPTNPAMMKGGSGGQ